LPQPTGSPSYIPLAQEASRASFRNKLMTITLEGRVAQANGRLKAANVGISIELDGGSLYLRGTLPPRPGAKSLQPCQQRVSLKRLGIRANAAGIAEAE
jgi:hypothetical protein